MLRYYELWGEECIICLQHDLEYFFINECSCKHLICITCIAKLNKCPFCRKGFCRNTLTFTDAYRIHDIDSPYHKEVLLLKAEQHWDLSNKIHYTMYTELTLFNITCTDY